MHGDEGRALGAGAGEDGLRLLEAVHLRLALLHARVEELVHPVAVRAEVLEERVRGRLRIRLVLLDAFKFRDCLGCLFEPL